MGDNAGTPAPAGLRVIRGRAVLTAAGALAGVVVLQGERTDVVQPGLGSVDEFLGGTARRAGG